MDVLQKIEETSPQKQKIPMSHFRDKKLGFYGSAAHEEKKISLSYLGTDTNGFALKMQEMVSLSGSFLPGNIFTDLPVSVSVSIVPDMPVSWQVSYMFPQSPENYLNSPTDSFGEHRSTFSLSVNGIESYSLSLSAKPTRFVENGEMKGIKMQDVSCSIEIESFSELPPDFVDPYFQVEINPNTLDFTRTLVESVEDANKWKHSWTGTL